MHQGAGSRQAGSRQAGCRQQAGSRQTDRQAGAQKSTQEHTGAYRRAQESEQERRRAQKKSPRAGENKIYTKILLPSDKKSTAQANEKDFRVSKSRRAGENEKKSEKNSFA